MTANDFVTLQRQVVLFTPDEEVSSAKLLRGLVPNWADRFGGEPIVLPGAEGAPRQMPRLILQSADGVWRSEISSERINLFWRRVTQEEQAPAPTEAVALLQEYREFLGARIGRLAVVLTRAAPHESPATLLAGHFCKAKWLEAPFNRPENFELHSHKRFQLPKTSLTVNSWVRSKTGTVSSKENPQPVVLVEQDINTLAEEADQRDFNADEIDLFFTAANDEFDVILRLYYPNGGGE
jgi:hypothetical protein